MFSVSCCISLRYASLLQAHNVRTNGVIRAKIKEKEEKKDKKGGNDQFAMTTKYGPAVCDSEGMTFPWL